MQRRFAAILIWAALMFTACVTSRVAAQGLPDLVWLQGGQLGAVATVTFSPDSELLASCSSGGVKIWRPPSRMLFRSLPANETLAVAFSLDGQFVASAGHGAHVWRLSDGARVDTP